LQRCESFLHA